jgi:hypothetical protein
MRSAPASVSAKRPRERAAVSGGGGWCSGRSSWECVRGCGRRGCRGCGPGSPSRSDLIALAPLHAARRRAGGVSSTATATSANAARPSGAAARRAAIRRLAPSPAAPRCSLRLPPRCYPDGLLDVPPVRGRCCADDKHSSPPRPGRPACRRRTCPEPERTRPPARSGPRKPDRPSGERARRPATLGVARKMSSPDRADSAAAGQDPQSRVARRPAWAAAHDPRPASPVDPLGTR